MGRKLEINYLYAEFQLLSYQIAVPKTK